jgi:hypothetical protein
VTTTSQTLLAVDRCFVAPSLRIEGSRVPGATLSAGPVARGPVSGVTALGGRSARRRTAASWASKSALVVHPQKFLGMAGAYINANVWPLSPQGQSSG